LLDWIGKFAPQVGWAIFGALASQLVIIFLPEKIRVTFTLWQKVASKVVRNPAYTIGITARLDCKEPMDLEEAKRQLADTYRARQVTSAGTELNFRELVPGGQLNIKIQLAYEEDRTNNRLSVFSFNVTVDSHTRYRQIRDRIEDIRSALASAENALLKTFQLYPAKRALYIEVERLAEFSEWLRNLEAQQITGKIKNAEAEFHYYERRLVVEDTINSATIKWLKNIVAHVG
jgi:hypothetical protein